MRAEWKELVVYISMGFGNPYGDKYSIDIVTQFAGILVSLGVSVISLADTVGLATADEIAKLFNIVKSISEDVEWGVHLHAAPQDARAKIEAAVGAGCQRIDGLFWVMGVARWLTMSLWVISIPAL